MISSVNHTSEEKKREMVSRKIVERENMRPENNDMYSTCMIELYYY